MNGLIIFFVTMAVSLLDPLAVIGYLLAGIFIKDFWFSLAAGLAWAAAMIGIIVLTNSGYQIQALAVAGRLLGGVIFTAAVFGLTGLVRNRTT